MKLGIIGYGKMGKAIERLAFPYGFISFVIIDNEDDWLSKQNDLKKCSAAVEFSTQQSALSNLLKCFELGVPVVTGTTGWKEKNEYLNLWKNNSISIVCGSNFSIGANIFFKLNEWLARQMKIERQYNITIEETHHIYKKDAPSGTALTIQQGILSQLDNQLSIPIVSHREGEMVGEHLVNYSSSEDVIQIKHNVITRDAFAHGALKAAAWLINNPGAYAFEDIFLSL